MKATKHTALSLLLALPIVSFSAIVSGIDTIPVNKNIKLISHATTDNTRDTSASLRAGYVYPCAAQVPPMDIFAASELLSTCTYPCDVISIGSPRPFYYAKIKLSSLDLSKPLNLTDTNMFISCDTVRVDAHVRDSSHCYLPHVLFGKYQTALLTGDFAVFQGADNKYVLAKFDTLISIHTSFEPMPVQRPYLSAFRVSWYYQGNGSLDFKNISGVIWHDAQLIRKTAAPRGCFDMRGRRIDGVQTKNKIRVIGR